MNATLPCEQCASDISHEQKYSNFIQVWILFIVRLELPHSIATVSLNFLLNSNPIYNFSKIYPVI